MTSKKKLISSASLSIVLISVLALNLYSENDSEPNQMVEVVDNYFEEWTGENPDFHKMYKMRNVDKTYEEWMRQEIKPIEDLKQKNGTFEYHGIVDVKETYGKPTAYVKQEISSETSNLSYNGTAIYHLNKKDGKWLINSSTKPELLFN